MADGSRRFGVLGPVPSDIPAAAGWQQQQQQQQLASIASGWQQQQQLASKPSGRQQQKQQQLASKPSRLIRRGRRPGKYSDSDAKQKKNRSERERVKDIGELYYSLRAVLSGKTTRGKLSKVAVLQATITYIHSLSSELKRIKSDLQPPPPHAGPEDYVSADVEISISPNEWIVEVFIKQIL